MAYELCIEHKIQFDTDFYPNHLPQILVSGEEYELNKLQNTWKTCRLLYRIFFFLQLVFILEQLHAITSVPPETPHEKWFQEKFGKCHSRILYPAKRETVQKFLLVQNASWAVEMLSLSRNVPLYGQLKVCMHRD